MMPPLLPRRIFPLDPRDFAPLPLVCDDAVPLGIVLLVAYPGPLDPDRLAAGLSRALDAFPHLTGRPEIDFDPFQARLVPSDRKVVLETVSEVPGNAQEMAFLPQEELLARYSPTRGIGGSGSSFLQDPLLALRLSSWSRGGGCVLGILASHLALDGVGLALFLEHLSAAMVGRDPPSVRHDRRETFVDSPSVPGLPPRYRVASPLDLLAASGEHPLDLARPTVFALPGVDRIAVATRLARLAAGALPGLQEAALWCNARGLGVPKSYTGNAGCYVHVPLDDELESRLRGFGTRSGFAEIAETYRRIKARERAGELVFWDGPGVELLSLNLVPSGRNAPDLGSGKAVHAELLTRNVSGLRLYATAAGDATVVECSLPGSVGQILFETCFDDGLSPVLWHRG